MFLQEYRNTCLYTIPNSLNQNRVVEKETYFFGYEAHIVYHISIVVRIFWSGNDYFIYIPNYAFNWMIILNSYGRSYVYKSTIFFNLWFLIFSWKNDVGILVWCILWNMLLNKWRLLLFLTDKFVLGVINNYISIMDFTQLLNTWYTLLLVEYPKKMPSSLLGSNLRICSLLVRI